VVDLRTIRPLDRDTILASLSRTNRLVAVEEGPVTGGWAAEVLAIAVDGGLTDIDLAWRLTTPDRPVPFSGVLEDQFFPTAQSIAASVRTRLA
jgi:pyruvate/2-oxoglutarate/acetoin dehydrogenase E1 component